MKDPRTVTAEPTGSIGPLSRVPVIVEVINGKLKCTPDHVVIFGNEEVEWIYNPGGHSVVFNGTGPFGKPRHDATGPSLPSGPHVCKDRELFKYTISVPDKSVKPLDPVVDADPRKRPRLK